MYMAIICPNCNQVCCNMMCVNVKEYEDLSQYEDFIAGTSTTKYEAVLKCEHCISDEELAKVRASGLQQLSCTYRRTVDSIETTVETTSNANEDTEWIL